jgi:hypothetical protein
MKLNFFQRESKTSKVLKSWIASPDKIIISDHFEYPDRAEISKTKEVVTYVSALNQINNLLSKGADYNTDANLNELVVILQNVSDKDIYKALKDKAIPVLEDVYKNFQQNTERIKKDQFSNTDLMMLKIFCIYSDNIPNPILIEAIKEDHRSTEYLWSVIFGVLSERSIDHQKFIDELNGFLPSNFLGVSFLDYCNQLLISDKIKFHPYNTDNGKEQLLKMVQTKGDDYSYAVSATTAVPFLDETLAKNLLSKASENNNVEVKIEAAWAGTKLGLENHRNDLVEFTKDFRYSSRASEYLKELNFENLIPAESKSDDFVALSEMCNWLSHPNEFGSYPDSAEILDNRVLFWPPTNDQRKLYLIKYTYTKFNDDESDEVGIGMVGSVTFSLFGLENILKKTPEEIYAIHCNWELEDEDYENVEKGLKRLRSKNTL